MSCPRCGDTGIVLHHERREAVRCPCQLRDYCRQCGAVLGNETYRGTYCDYECAAAHMYPEDD
jgi:hypothetical protein